MGALYRFLATNEGLIYILLALGGLFAFRWLWKSWKEWRESVYGLEREFALRRLSRALAISLLILFLFIAEMALASFVLPTLPASELLETPTLNLLNQPAGKLSGNAPIAMTASPLVPASDGAANGCLPGQLILTFPEPGQEVSGNVQLLGTVNIPDFGFYKYEVAPQGSNAWATILAGTQLVTDGEVGTWDTSILTPGDYQLRLVATDSQGQELPPCIIPIRVIAPP